MGCGKAYGRVWKNRVVLEKAVECRKLEILWKVSGGMGELKLDFLVAGGDSDGFMGKLSEKFTVEYGKAESYLTG